MFSSYWFLYIINNITFKSDYYINSGFYNIRCKFSITIFYVGTYKLFLNYDEFNNLALETKFSISINYFFSIINHFTSLTDAEFNANYNLIS